jgi:putative transposase
MIRIKLCPLTLKSTTAVPSVYRDTDYTTAGAYFITICTKNRQCLFGAIDNGQMRMNDAGMIAEQCWREIPAHFPHTALDEWVVMPNHVHGIVWIHGGDAGTDDVDTVIRVKLHEVLDRTFFLS